jgi:predicted NAD/FAD-binding protein
VTAPQQQKLKIRGPVVVTANRLRDGTVVYRTAGNGWSTDLANAAVATTADEAKALLASAAGDGVAAVDPYVAPVEFATDRRVLPGNLRERIRLDGPTFALPGA